MNKDDSWKYNKSVWWKCNELSYCDDDSIDVGRERGIECVSVSEYCMEVLIGMYRMDVVEMELKYEYGIVVNLNRIE